MNSELVQKHFVVDDEMIDSGYVQEVITPLWWGVSIYDGETEMYDALEHFTEPQKYVWAVQWYKSEVTNGGHAQFFMNSSGIVWEIALEALRVINCPGAADILEEAAERLGGCPSMDKDNRWLQMKRHNAQFDDLDRAAWDHDSMIDKALNNYVAANREAFYFDGDVMVPEYMAMDGDDLFIPGFSGYATGHGSSCSPADYDDFDE